MSTPIKATTQEHLDILDITNNIVLYKTGSASMAIRLNAVNFNLLSAQEQESIIYTYASLLNSLSFPIQILIRSQKKDISNYLQVIMAQEARQLNPTLKQRITAYRQFIERIVKERNVLDKKFYVIIPFSATELGLNPNTLNPLAKAPQKPAFEKSYIIEKALNSLEPKRDHLMRQFTHLGLTPKQLSTQELIQLFYNIYNPDSDETVQITSSQNYQTPITQAQQTPAVKKITQNLNNQTTNSQELQNSPNLPLSNPNVTQNQPSQSSPRSELLNSSGLQSQDSSTTQNPQPQTQSSQDQLPHTYTHPSSELSNSSELQRQAPEKPLQPPTTADQPSPTRQPQQLYSQ